MAQAQPKIIPSGALTGILDLRSSPEELVRGSLRMRQNLQTVGEGKLRRGSGWEKLLNKTSGYNNADFHDQMLSVSSAIRQPVTMLFEAESSRKVRFLLAATQSVIAQLNAYSGAWTILGKGFGGQATTDGTAPRFKCARQGDYVVFTNDLDKVQYMVLEQPADTNGKFILPIDDMDVIGLSRARVIWCWHNCIFLANVEMDATRFGNRLVWSNFDDPTSFDPAKLNSITGFKDLYSHETILAGAPVGDVFCIYTTHGIWQMTVVGGEESFAFNRVYNGESNTSNDTRKCVLAYPNTLVNVHDGHAYLAIDGAYYFNPWTMVPDRPEWLHKATADLFDNIDTNACDAHIGIPWGDEVYFSIARKDAPNHLPDYTLRINKTYRAVDVVDAGFSAFCQFSPDQAQTVRDFIIENRICTLAGLTAAGYPYGPEGLPANPISPIADFAPDSFYTTITQTIGDVTTEDWNQANPSAHSLCTLLAGAVLDTICRECRGLPLLVGANSVDWCLKSLGTVFYRERCANPTAAGVTTADGYQSSVGSYLLDPITSIIRFPAVNIADSLSEFSQFEIKYLAVPQANPLPIGLRVGISAQPADSNATGDAIVWFTHRSQPLKLMTGKTMAEHIRDKTVPMERAHWHLWRVGRFIHIELSISGVGGDALFGSVEAELKSAGSTRNF